MTVTGARLIRQHLAGVRLRTPAAVVAQLGAVQAQELPQAFWAVGQRTEGCTLAEVQRALDDGLFLRTHVLRPTWHFVARADVRWLLELTAPRVRRMAASYDRVHGIDDGVRATVRRVCEQQLGEGRHLTRGELGTALSAAGVVVTGGRLAQLMLHAELDGVVVSGRMQGRTQTYALLDERAPDATTLSGDEALRALTVRYFTSHGPATVKDFGWWASLTVAQVRSGLGLAGDLLAPIDVDGMTYWSAADDPPARATRASASLLEPYDEFLVGYKESRGLVGVAAAAGAGWAGGVGDLGARTVLLGDQVRGVWSAPSRGAEVAVRLIGPPATGADAAAMTREAARYARFLGAALTLTVS